MKNYGIIRTLFQFHETRRWKNMFKKTLLALAVAGASMSATAGILSVNVIEGPNTQNATDVAAIVATDVDGCAQAATILGVTATADSGVTPDSAAGADTVNDTTPAASNVYSPAASTVNYTAADTCDVYIADELVSADDAKYSQEGAAAAGLSIDAAFIAGVGGVKAEDTIEFTITGGTIDEDKSALATLAATTNDFSLLGVTGSTISFTVDSDVAATAYTGRNILALENVIVTPDAGVEAVAISSTVRNTAGVLYDTADSVEITKIAKQYSANVFVALDGLIDVATERFDFVSNEDDTTVGKFAVQADEDYNNAAENVQVDTLVIGTKLETTQGNLAANEGASIVVKGDFSWLSDYADEDGDIDFSTIIAYTAYSQLDINGDLAAANADATNTLTVADVSLNEEMNELTLPLAISGDDAAELAAYHAIQFTVLGQDDEDAVTSLNATDFFADFEVVSSITADNVALTADADLNVATDLDVGEWTLNGSVVEVPYIPFGPNTQPIIRHTNTGAQTGDISVRYMVEEGNGLAQTHVWKSLGVLVEDAEPGVRNLLSEITTALEAELGQDKFKVALEITTNVPGDDVTVFAAAKISAEGQDRLTIGAFKGQ